ncbi:GNAT family N-acetyltransferase [Amycolatopsis australiensis]|uniref:Acetyltransferase (GNAT) family protein n=1 Tax=Amycolatopsis australiensis TaxID=546364 RepID=A0A1K1SV95_9PSEU|nr:GNAT family N-acetyltransferase [Amycolatopsis australiensis]SFW88320.1 Acetyltransferase (GNAT) family protein [Amycolatopsis australiensis]
MADYVFPELPEIEKAYRAAYRALAALAPGTVTIEEETSFPEVLSQFPFLLDRADLATTAHLGPAVSWQASRQDDLWDLAVAGIDLDGDEHDFDGAVLGAEVTEGPGGRWHGSALDRAGLAYKRACGWDFAPGESGVWLLMLAPVGASGGEEGLWFFSGRLAGFVIVYDRDEDGAYESVGHIWTASAWQRRGIARRLLTEARSRFSITTVEEPYTEKGAAFLRACPE